LLGSQAGLDSFDVHAEDGDDFFQLSGCLGQVRVVRLGGCQFAHLHGHRFYF
jgi:hypothetical protein